MTLVKEMVPYMRHLNKSIKETVEKIECITIKNFYLSKECFCENKKTYQKLEENIWKK